MCRKKQDKIVHNALSGSAEIRPMYGVDVSKMSKAKLLSGGEFKNYPQKTA